MCGTRSQLPERKTIDMEQDSETGTNIAEINFDLRTESETSNAFIQVHQGTMVGMTVGILVTIIIALLLYGFGRCWCARIHRLCGEDRPHTSNNMEMGRNISAGSVDNKTDETDETEKTRRNSKIII